MMVKVLLNAVGAMVIPVPAVKVNVSSKVAGVMVTADPVVAMMPKVLMGTTLLTQAAPLYFKICPLAAEVIVTSVRSSKTTAPPPPPPPD